jgi:hypothetical protein
MVPSFSSRFSLLGPPSANYQGSFFTLGYSALMPKLSHNSYFAEGEIQVKLQNHVSHTQKRALIIGYARPCMAP